MVAATTQMPPRFGERFGQMLGDARDMGQLVSRKLPPSVVGLADDAAIYANSRMGAVGQPYAPNALPDGNDVESAKDARNIAAKARSGNAEVQSSEVPSASAPRGAMPNFKPIGEAGGIFNIADPVMGAAETASHYAMLGLVAPDLAWAVGKGVGKLNWKSGEKWLTAPSEYLNPSALKGTGKMSMGQHLNNAMMGGFAIIQGYGVAKTAAQGLDSLKHMNEALTGIPADKVSTIQLLTSKDVPDIVKEARSHYLKEVTGRAGANLLNVGLLARAVLQKRMQSWKEFLIPAAVGGAVDMIMGESVLPFFAGVMNAQKTGEKLPPQAYGEFLMAASKDLRNHGSMGRAVAMKLGEVYAAENKPVGAVLKEIEESQQAHKHGHTSLFDQRISAAIAQGQAERAALKKAQADQLAQHGGLRPVRAAQAANVPSMTMVDKIGKGGQAHAIEVKGKFTEKLQQEMHAVDKGVGGVTVP